SSLKYFRAEYEDHITGRGCPFDPAKSTAWADRHRARRTSVRLPAQQKAGLAP
ncbi:NADH-quinone oxidoreductase subunit F, partial [Streptomyces bottropensis]